LLTYGDALFNAVRLLLLCAMHGGLADDSARDYTEQTAAAAAARQRGPARPVVESVRNGMARAGRKGRFFRGIADYG
jgi:hypothetical protein